MRCNFCHPILYGISQRKHKKATVNSVHFLLPKSRIFRILFRVLSLVAAVLGGLILLILGLTLAHVVITLLVIPVSCLSRAALTVTSA